MSEIVSRKLPFIQSTQNFYIIIMLLTDTEPFMGESVAGLSLSFKFTPHMLRKERIEITSNENNKSL